MEKHIVIAGAGFAGLSLAKKLKNKPNIKVTLIDQVNYHQFQPLMYQVATAGLDASNIAFPLRKIFQNCNNITIVLAKIQKILPEQKMVITENSIIHFDTLVLATGCTTNFYGNANLEKFALPMKSITEAINIRHKLLQNLELATHLVKNRSIKHLYNIVIVGAGPTGVELSGALAELKQKVLPKDFPELDFTNMSIYLIEKGATTLGAMSYKSNENSIRYLIESGIKVLTNSGVKDYDGKTVILENGTTINAALLIWTAGIKGNIPEGINSDCITFRDRIAVDEYHRVKGHDGIFAIGDVAEMQLKTYPKGHPQVCKVANDQGKHLADIILQKTTKPFRYQDRGSMATIGRNKAVVDNFPFKKVHFSGFPAWIMWMGFHLLQLIGVKNKIQVFVNWLYHYITFDQSLRLIFKPPTLHNDKIDSIQK